MDSPYHFTPEKHARYDIVELIKIARRPMRRALGRLEQVTLEPTVTEQVNTVLRALDNLESVVMNPVLDECRKLVSAVQAARKK